MDYHHKHHHSLWIALQPGGFWFTLMAETFVIPGTLKQSGLERDASTKFWSDLVTLIIKKPPPLLRQILLEDFLTWSLQKKGPGWRRQTWHMESSRYGSIWTWGGETRTRGWHYSGLSGERAFLQSPLRLWEKKEKWASGSVPRV